MTDILNRYQIKQALGLILLLVFVSQICLKVKPQERLHPKWMVLAFSGSGIRLGVVVMGGLPGRGRS